MNEPIVSVDLNAERDASRARRDRDHQDTSARVLLRLAALGGYFGGLEEWCDHQHPHWTPERRAALVARARELQAQESAAHTLSPDQVMRLRPAAWLPSDDVLSNPVERAALDARLLTRTHEPRPAAPAATEDAMPKTEGSTPTAAPESARERPSTSDVRRVITEILTAHPAQRFGEVQAALEKRYGVPFKVGHMGKAWHRARVELGLDEETASGVASEAGAPEPAAELAPEPTPAPAAPDPSAAPVIEEAVPTAVATAPQGVHVEETPGGWRLRADIQVASRGEAFRLMAGLGMAL